MTDQTAAVTLSHPPAAILRVMNPLVGMLLRTPLAGPLGEQMMVVNVTGRKSGRRYSIPLSAHLLEGELYAISSAAWKHNFRGGAPADVLHRGTTTRLQGELISDRAAVADLAHRCAQSYGVKRAERMMGLKFRDQRVPTVEEFAEAVDRDHLAAIHFTPTG